MNFGIEYIKELTNNIGKLLGEKCEVVVHDFTKGYNSTIVHIVNGTVTGREVGGCATNIFYEHIQAASTDFSQYSQYFNTLPDGRVIKSSSTFLRDKSGKIIAAVCINIDVTDIITVMPQLTAFIQNTVQNEQIIENEHFARDVHDLMENYLERVQKYIGKGPTEMNKKEKLMALKYLESKGILQIAKANVKLCEFFSISKFTLYNYLNEIHESKEE